MNIFKSRVVAVSAGALMVVGLGAGGAVAGAQIGTQGIANQSIRQWDLHENSVGLSELNKYAQSKIESGGEQGPQGEPGVDGADGADGVSGHEVDGFYRTLPAGDGSTVETFSAECATGKVATGGGFSVDFPQDRANVRVVGSLPAGFEPIEGDPELSVRATAWEVHVINDGPETSLRPWVVCADIPAAN